mgnify:CR=1 FL=1
MPLVRLITSVSRLKLPRVVALFFLFSLLTTASFGQYTPAKERLERYDRHVSMTNSSSFSGLEWQFAGPTNISGRMTDVAVVAPRGDNYAMYVAGATGGVWKTDNEGTTWEPVFEHGPSTSIGDVTVSPSNPNVVWIGTGEANIFRSSMAGAGVFKSTNAGESWTYMGLAETHTIARIVIHPTNPDIVYVSASGHEWTKNKDRGIYKTTNGGSTWTKILYRDDETAAIDLVMSPDNPNVLYAAMWQRVRNKWNDPRNEPHYTGSGILRSDDAGATWNEINSGLPSAQFRGRIGIDVSVSNPNVIYAFVDNYEAAREAKEEETDSYGRPRGPIIYGATLYRSDNRGDSWRRVSEQNAYMEGLSSTYGWVFGQMRVDPNDENRVYLMGLALNVSDDAGKTFRRLPGMHGDHHGLWIDPDNSDYLVNVNDGGLAISYDRGENWKRMWDGLPLVQFFNVSHDMAEPFNVYGSVQDHGSYKGTIDLSRGRSNIPAVAFQGAPGGEGSRHAIDPTDPDIVYSAGFYGTISRSDLSIGSSTSIMPERVDPDQPLRGQWLAKFIISPHNPRILYHGMNYLFRSMNRGESWEAISPDLTTNNLAELGDIQYQTIFSVSESPFKFGLIYVGTDDGRVHVTRNSGEKWTDLTSKFPKKRWIAKIEASLFEEGTVFVAQNGKRDEDFTPYLYRSDDFGATWKDLAAGIPSGPINVVTQDPTNKNILYVGTDLGAYVTVDAGATWSALANGLPTTFVSDLAVHPTEDILVASTHGRGIYVMDVRPLQELAADSNMDDFVVLEPETVQLPAGFRGGSAKAKIYFYTAMAGNVTFTVLDSKGTQIHTFSQPGVVGLNAVDWDLTSETDNQRVSAGTYSVSAILGGRAVQTTLIVSRN